jgi:hypothetical protein
MIRRLGAPLLFAFAVTVAATAMTSCVAKPAADTFLQADDTAAVEDGTPFDPNSIVDPGSFQDTLTIDLVAVSAFLDKTPYKRASFLSTYQSNGMRAADAIVRAAQAHKINPLVILVRAEVDQGLIGAQFYPFPPSRVEYVFGCGCVTLTKCDPALAGFDRQADCLARKLRTSLDEIAKDGVTAGGWGPNQTTTTFDGVKVTPANESTATLYQYSPIVGVGKSGAWLFWNIWQLYASFLEYEGPVAGGPTGSWIGEPCTADANCIAPNALCATNFPGGMCTVGCTTDCPQNPDKPEQETFCADFGTKGGYCLPTCTRSVGGCRQGYECRTVYQAGSTTVTRDVCVKQD